MMGPGRAMIKIPNFWLPSSMQQAAGKSWQSFRGRIYKILKWIYMRAEKCAFFKYTIQVTGINSHFDTFVTFPPTAASKKLLHYRLDKFRRGRLRLRERAKMQWHSQRKVCHSGEVDSPLYVLSFLQKLPTMWSRSHLLLDHPVVHSLVCHHAKMAS